MESKDHQWPTNSHSATCEMYILQTLKRLTARCNILLDRDFTITVIHKRDPFESKKSLRRLKDVSSSDYLFSLLSEWTSHTSDCGSDVKSWLGLSYEPWVTNRLFDFTTQMIFKFTKTIICLYVFVWKYRKCRDGRPQGLLGTKTWEPLVSRTKGIRRDVRPYKIEGDETIQSRVKGREGNEIIGMPKYVKNHRRIVTSPQILLRVYLSTQLGVTVCL